MPKLLIVSTLPGALEGFLLPFVEYFKTQNWQVEGMARDVSHNQACVAAFDRVWDVEWSRNPLAIQNLFVATSRIQDIVIQGNYDIVHVHTPVAAFVTRYALRNLPKRSQLIYTAHGFHFYQGGNLLKNSIFLGLEKLAGAWTDYLITINRQDEAQAHKHQLLPPERIYYTPGIGVDINYYHPDRVTPEDVAAIKQELGLSSSDTLLLCVAEFTPNKRHQDQIKALKQTARADIHLTFAGDGDTNVQLRQLTTQLDLTQQVHFLGFRSDIPALIKASNATLLTSAREGLPRSVMEALCLETPVIGTKARGTQDLLSDGCGLLVEVGDVAALAQSMIQIADYPERAIAMGKKGRVKIADYDIKHIIKSYENIYNLALNSND